MIQQQKRKVLHLGNAAGYKIPEGLKKCAGAFLTNKCNGSSLTE